MYSSMMNLDLTLPDVLTPPFEQRPHLGQLGRVHFIGIAGAGMSAVARLMLQAGVEVSGSDRAPGKALTELEQLGARVWAPQDAARLAGVDTVVVSTAIQEDNPELLAAREQGLSVLHRSQALAAVMADSRVVAVAGTHGKTTTSSMIAFMLDALGLDPSFAVGSTISGLETNARLGAASSQPAWFVAEADESDGSFVRYRPHLAVVTNVEPDHIVIYGSAQNVYEAFNRFVASMQPEGILITCADDPGARELAVQAKRAGLATITYGQSDLADVRISGTTSEGTVCSSRLDWDFSLQGQSYAGQSELVLKVPGIHNQLNAAAAFVCGLLAGFSGQQVPAALGQFRGTDRRFSLRGDLAGIKVFDDYAHHPTEVLRALEAGRTVAAGHNLYVLFQPHLFSRTQEFAADFARALSQADRAYVLDIYPAREKPIAGVTSQLISNAGFSEIHYVESGQKAVELLAEQVKPGDVVMTVGAGNVTDFSRALVSRLAELREG